MATSTLSIDRAAAGSSSPWLFSATIDVAVFLGSALVSLGLLAVGAMTGVLHDDTPEWAWVPAILLIDVAHVYATAFRVYFDVAEWRRRPWLYSGVPVAGWLVGVAVYSESDQLFWRVLAYLAVFHFVRQQYGWMMLYRAKVGEQDAWGRRIDAAAIYAATLYPLLYWHAHLPRAFWWFLPHDFIALPQQVSQFALPLYVGCLIAYAVRAVLDSKNGQRNPGKHIVLITTAVCWYVGIVLFNSDYAFTVTNVVIHGVPYMALVWWYMQRRPAERDRTASSPWRTAFILLCTVWLLAYAEELLWDRMLWHERPWLFGSSLDVGDWSAWLVPALAVPQLTHYILDGFIWKRRSNPRFTLVGSVAPDGST